MQRSNTDKQISITREEMLTKVKPTQHWSGFDDFIYEVKKIPIVTALKKLRTCWGSKHTFVTMSRRYLYNPKIEYRFEDENTIEERIKDTLQLAKTFENRGPTQITSFLHRDLKK